MGFAERLHTDFQSTHQKIYIAQSLGFARVTAMLGKVTVQLLVAALGDSDDHTHGCMH